MKLRKTGIFLLFLGTLLTGCTSQPEAPLPLVTRVQISGQLQDAPFSSQYTDPDKMETILRYLRGLKTGGAPDTDPERIMGSHYRICIYRSDGTCHIYRQQADRYLSVDSRPWKKIPPKKALRLAGLLKTLPPDHF